MAECTHRLWAYTKLASQVKGVVVLPQPPQYKIPPFVQQAMKYMQIPAKDIHIVSKVTEVEHLFVPEQASMLGNRLKLSNDYLDFLTENEEKFFHSYEPENV